MAPTLSLRQLQRTDARFLAIAGATAAGIAFLDCLIYQQLRGALNIELAARWLLATMAPWTLAWIALAQIRAQDRSRAGATFAAVGAGLVLAVAADALLFASEAPGPWQALGQRLQAELPIAAGLLLLRWPWPAPELEGPSGAAIDPRWERLADCDLCRAAGNYVEVVRGQRTELVRARLAEVEATLRHLGFVRVHRSTIVARRLIAGLENEREGLAAVRLSDGRRVRVGRSYRAAVYALRREPRDPAVRN